MKRAARIASALFTGLLACLAAAAAATPTPVFQVLAQELEKVRESGAVVSAVWTHRSDSCTLQILLRSPFADFLDSRKAGVSRPEPAPLAHIQVWLLGPDGLVIPPSSRPVNDARLPPVPNLRSLEQPIERFYRFPLYASENAVAVAIMVNDELYIEKLALPANRK